MSILTRGVAHAVLRPVDDTGGFDGHRFARRGATGVPKAAPFQWAIWGLESGGGKRGQNGMAGPFWYAILAGVAAGPGQIGETGALRSPAHEVRTVQSGRVKLRGAAGTGIARRMDP